MDPGAGKLVQPASPDERWPRPLWPRATPRILAACVISTGLLASVVVATAWLDRSWRTPVTAEQETPVEVVEDVPQPPREPPAAAEPPPAPAPPPAPMPAPSSDAAPTPPPTPQPSDEAATPARPVEVEVSRGLATGEPTADPSSAPEGTVPSPLASAAPAEEEAKDPPVPSEQEAATAAHRLVPPSFRGAALPGATVQTQESYKSLVFGMLERAKRLPARTPGRQGVMAAFVRFMLDRAGNLVDVSLIGSTGDAELDAEALALVRRAAPFPKPPPEGTLLTFTPVIYFGYDD